jgi:hypothetical protein
MIVNFNNKKIENIITIEKKKGEKEIKMPK